MNSWDVSLQMRTGAEIYVAVDAFEAPQTNMDGRDVGGGVVDDYIL